jgi:AraC family ethanolamine operon transcriptional activator
MAPEMQYTVHDSSDVNEHAALLPQWEQLYEQVSSGRFSGRLEDLSFGPVEVFRETTGPAVLQRGRARPGTVTLGVSLGSGSEAWFLGRSLRPGQPLAVEAGHEFELASRGAFDVVAISADIDALSDYSQRVDGRPFTPGTVAGRVVDSGIGGEALTEVVLTTLANARDNPRLLDQAPVQRALVQSMYDTMLGHLAAPIRCQTSDITAASRQRVVRQARAYMGQHAEEPITVPELCEALHVSRRTLQYSFQDVLQMSPVSYLRALRLNGVRRELRRGGDEPVADRAARWGFWHLSRFAADYRRMFAELPSETLRRARGGEPV